MKSITSIFLSLTLMASLSTAVFATDITTDGGSSSVPVELTQEVTTFSVTVPTVLPIEVDNKGEVTVATDNKIINNSYGMVEVKGVEVQSQNGWVLQNFNTDFKTKRVGIKEYGFQLNGENVAIDGSCSADSFEPISGNDEISFSYNANIATQSTALEDIQIANVVFTMGWYLENSSNGGTTYATAFADNSWSDIIDAVQNDAVPSTWSVGDTKSMTIDGTEYNIQIIGKDHDTYTSGGTAPLTFQLVELYGEKAQMNSTADNTTGWSGSAMRSTTLPAILSNMPSEVQSAIKAVDKQTLKGDKSGLETTSDKLFLLSEVEVFGTTSYSNGNAEGSRYAYYANGGATIKNFNGSAISWWLRGPLYSSTNRFSIVNHLGYLDYGSAYNDIGGVSFGFCF